METKNKPFTNVNTNNNTNNVHVKVHVEQPKKRAVTKKQTKPNWYTRAILGSIIALILSVFGYYIKKNMDDEGKGNTTIVPNGQLIEGTKTN